MISLGRIVCHEGSEDIAKRLMAALRAEAGPDMFIEVTGHPDLNKFDVSMCDGHFRYPTYCIRLDDGSLNRVSPEEFARRIMEVESPY